jgi:hypothetical protein
MSPSPKIGGRVQYGIQTEGDLAIGPSLSSNRLSSHMLQNFCEENLVDVLRSRVAHEWFVDDALWTSESIVSCVATRRRADVVDESDTHNGFGIAARREIHPVDVASGF